MFPIYRPATWYPMIQAQVPRHHCHMFPQVLGTFQEVLTKQSVESIPIQIQQRWKLGIFNFSVSCNVLNFCTFNFLNPANITLVVFMDYLTHLLKNRHHNPFCTEGQTLLPLTSIELSAFILIVD
ncbi:hypothetical protein ACTFIW_008793 [Dictyostelium discoideum]